MNNKVKYLTYGAMIAAIYVVLTLFISAFNLASGNIQIRISEALCVLPAFTSSAIPGLFVGCLIANLITGASIFDIVFGSIATLIGALGTYLLRKHLFLSTLPPVISNAVIIPFVLRYAYGYTFYVKGIDFSIPFFALTVGIGEIISICILGSLLIKVLSKHPSIFE